MVYFPLSLPYDSLSSDSFIYMYMLINEWIVYKTSCLISIWEDTDKLGARRCIDQQRKRHRELCYQMVIVDYQYWDWSTTEVNL